MNYGRLRNRPTTGGEIVLLCIAAVLFGGQMYLDGSETPRVQYPEATLHDNDHAAPATEAPAAAHHVAHRPGEPFPSWVPMAVAGGAGVIILGLGAAGAFVLMRRDSGDTDLDLLDDPELLALVKAHEADQ